MGLLQIEGGGWHSNGLLFLGPRSEDGLLVARLLIGQSQFADMVCLMTGDIPIVVYFLPLIGILTEQDADSAPESAVVDRVESFS